MNDTQMVITSSRAQKQERKEGQDNRRKMRGKREERGTTIERRTGQREPEAKHDGLKL